MKTSDILKMYEQGYSRIEIADEVLFAKEADTLNDAMMVVEDVLLHEKHLSNRVGGTFD